MTYIQAHLLLIDVEITKYDTYISKPPIKSELAQRGTQNQND